LVPNKFTLKKDKISSWLTAQHYNSAEDAELDSGCMYQSKARNHQMIRAEKKKAVWSEIKQ
jgi:hypothetical protein